MLAAEPQFDPLMALHEHAEPDMQSLLAVPQQRLAYVPSNVGLWPNLIHQKLVLLSVPASDVELVLLDEPTAELSHLVDVVFQRAIREAKDANTTVLLSGHMLSQVEMLPQEQRQYRTIQEIPN